MLLYGADAPGRAVQPTLRAHPWLWLIPITGATVIYLFGSEVAVLRHPGR